MKKTNISTLLELVFTEQQISRIPINLRNREVELEEIKNQQKFIAECDEASENFKIAGEHRKADWEKGWSGQGVFYSEDEYNNLPYYFANNTHVRIGGKIYKDCTGFTELNLLRALQAVVVGDALGRIKVDSLIEYGCGTGSNIQFLKTLYEKLEFYGADWVQSAIDKLITNKIVDKKHSVVVNYFDKTTFWAPKLPFIAFTNASLEQSGTRYKEFINYLIDNKNCAGAVHIEPIRELLDTNIPLNKQSYYYAEKRGYLNGFYEYLKTQDINIIQARDYGIGSKFLSGYQVIVWDKSHG